MTEKMPDEAHHLSPDVARIELTVVVEAARLQLTLGELMQLKAGDVVGQLATDAPVSLRVNGVVIARGRMELNKLVDASGPCVVVEQVLGVPFALDENRQE